MCTDVCIHSATGRSELDVDTHLAKQHKVIRRNCGAELNREIASYVSREQAVFVASNTCLSFNVVACGIS